MISNAMGSSAGAWTTSRALKPAYTGGPRTSCPASGRGLRLSDHSHCNADANTGGKHLRRRSSACAAERAFERLVMAGDALLAAVYVHGVSEPD